MRAPSVRDGGPPGPSDDDARPKPGHAEPVAATAHRYISKASPPRRRCSPESRRRAASMRLPQLACGCVDPWLCRCGRPALSDRMIDGGRAAALHLLDSGYPPLVEPAVIRALYRRGDRTLAEELHALTGRVVP